MLQPFPSFLTFPVRSRDECGTNGARHRAREVPSEATPCASLMGRWLVHRLHEPDPRVGIAGAPARSRPRPGALQDRALRGAVPRRPITRRCRGRRPGRTRRIGPCSSDLSRRADAQRRARPPPIHRWHTSIRYLALHTLRTSASPSVPSLDHSPRYRDRNAGGEPHRRNRPPAPVSSSAPERCPAGTRARRPRRSPPRGR